ncbi:decaprenyl-phosphate phosphoribosyltransferase [Calderihabitans maritimus]|uniref:Prenyltransferase, UbiA family n=1 Tax=Calderihabitans maritimus TaxID=1246530 RepID=A0A1Z5HWV6_9FIRM|nr:decaprenyl-phosphate phosphoribosyltransferase [Calderihabitans maritimus]GAW93994.1 prenyltransferase, UbiA family [Calderihabitans maritimus]
MKQTGLQLKRGGESFAGSQPYYPKSYGGFIRHLILELRPKQWTKNLIVFAALIFSENIFDAELLIRSIGAFFAFCFISGTVYILNDIFDREKDRLHPTKKYRPIASGKLSVTAATVSGIVILTFSLAMSFYLDYLFGVIMAFYFLINVAYTLRLKHVVIVDVMIIALGFILRAVSGAVVIGVQLTSWFLICTMLLALFLALAKRRHELVLLQDEKEEHRPVLGEYSTHLLDQLISIVTAATIMAYALYTFTSDKPVELMFTIPFVIYGMFRYLYLVHIRNQGGSPERILLEDKHILLTVILYGVSVIIILKYF